MPKYLMGVDIGTSGTKSIIADENGRVIASRTRGIPAIHPQARLGGTAPRGLVGRGGQAACVQLSQRPRCPQTRSRV